MSSLGGDEPAAGGSGHGGDTFTSFPVLFDRVDEESLGGRLKRFFSAAPTPSSSSSLGSTTASQASQTPSREGSPPPLPAPAAPTRTRTSSLAARHLDAIHEGGQVPFPSSAASSPSLAQPDHATLPNGRRFVRPIRLSGAMPSVRLTVAHSEKGDLYQSGSSRSIASEYGERSDYGGGSQSGGGGGGSNNNASMGTMGSPASETFAASLANLSSIPGFPLAKDMADDSKSIRSVSTVARPSASVAHIFRRLRGEGLSKEYWIRDESSKECFDCQTVFTSFRRKHHCRICGQIFCSRCASNIISSARFGSQGVVRVCNLCLSIMEDGESSPQSHSLANASPDARYLRSSLRDPGTRSGTTLTISAPLEASARPPQSQFAASHLFPRSETPYLASLGASLLGNRGGGAGGSEMEFEGTGRGSQASSRADTPGEYGDDGDAGSQPASPKRRLGSPLGLFSKRVEPENVNTAVAPFRRAIAEEADGLGIEEGDGGGGDDEELEPDSALRLGLPVEDDSRTPSPNPVGLGIIDDDDDEDPRATPPPPTSSSVAQVGLKTPAPASPEKAITSPLLPTTAILPPPTPTTDISPDGARATTLSRASTHVSLPFTPPLAGQSAFAAFANESAFLPIPSGPYSRLPRGRTGLSATTMDHLRTMLRQCLLRAEVPNPQAWEVELVKLLVRVARFPGPNVRNGDHIDIRRYVHVKKIPGGHPRDSEYVDGVVFTKNVLHKQMSRHLANPRVMLFSFPLEYQRVEGQLMSLDPLIKQESEYLRNLVARIVAQRPHIVLVERNVSRLAVEYLVEAGIAVARNVKPDMIAAVARATQADVVSSMDKLALEPRLGRCQTFRVQTFVHALIPGRRKTFMRFEGCNQELGCTLILRGGPMHVLAKVKRIVEMMILVVYSAKLEGHLLADELVLAPSRELSLRHQKSPRLPSEVDAPELSLNNLQAQDRERVSKDIAAALDPYQSIALSASPWVKFPPPYALARMSDEDRRVTALRRLREYEETEQIIHEEESSRQEQEFNNMSTSSSSLSLRSLSSSSGATGTTSSAATMNRTRSVSGSDVAALAKEPALCADDALRVLQTPKDLARATEFTEAEERHAEHLALWDAYVCQSKDSLDPADHQKLFVLETLACTQTSDRLCGPPTVRAITFYGEEDLTLGQYVEQIGRDAGKACLAPGCGRPMMVHYATWVHGHYRVSIIPEAHTVDLQSPQLEGQIVMWSWCKLCELRTQQQAMSEETYRLSFAKYLELCFYPQDLVRADGACTHNGHLDHVRFWMYRGITCQIIVEKVDLLNIVAPPLALRIKPEKQLQLRNEEYVTVLQKSTLFWDSIRTRIAQFNYDLVALDRLDESRVVMDDLAARCDVDRRAIVRLLERTYAEAQQTNGTEMTSVRRALQNKAVEWEAEFAAFEQRIIPSEKDVRRLTTVQLKRLFIDGGLPLSPERRVTSSSLAPSIELDEKQADGSSIDLTMASLRSTDPSSIDPDRPSTPTSSIDPNETSTSPSSRTSSSSLPPTPSALPTNLLSGTQSSDNESDSTVCAEPTVRIPSPFATRRRRPPETSAGESEHDETPVRRRTTPVVADLVNFFSDDGDTPARQSVKSRSAPSTVPRPGMRRNATDKPKSSPAKARDSPDVFSDGDSSYARNVGVSHLSNRAFAEKPSRIPARKTISKQPALAKAFEPLEPEPVPEPVRTSRPISSFMTGFGSRTSRSPTTSRPQSRSGSRSGRSTPALGGNHNAEGSSSTTRPRLVTANSGSSVSGPSKLIKVRRDGGGGYGSASASSDATGKSSSLKGKARAVARELGLSRPTTSSSNKATPTGTRRVASGPNHRVSTIANHFNKITREAERERQRKMALFRGKRVRPVAVAHSTVQVFDNVRDAIKEDSDDDDSHSSDGADDEYDEDVDVDDEVKPVPVEAEPVVHPSGPSEASSKESFVYDHPPESTDAAMHYPAARAADDSYNAQPLEDLAPPTDSEPPSVPPSPRLTDGFPVPRVSEGESSGTERGSIIKAISNLWTYRGGEFTPLEYPLHPSEHIFADNPILVREDEPSSIIAFALRFVLISHKIVDAKALILVGHSSRAYRDKLKEHEVARVVERTEAFMPDDVHPGDRSSTWGVLDLQPDGTDVEETLRKPEAKHFRLQFEEGTTKFFCKIFFAEQFDALRRNCGCSSQFVESLARCIKWESSGGRSKVDFLKTRDDRFIVKEISRLEMDSLLRFAPAYFDYMSKAFFHGLPTLLAKIYGFYRIGLRNPATGKVMRLDVLVMENLFYERQLTQVYDLKGSTRNRHVQVSPDRPNEVLMDENLVQISYKNPLYVREASKRFIRTAIHNDSLFLSNINVMDYSLVVGVDSVKQELVVGIVDFIRTYTWDKVLESWVKDSAFLGKSSKPGGPTIVTPKQYKNRFRDAMDAYFLLAPDPWLCKSSLLPVLGQKGAASESKECFEGPDPQAPPRTVPHA
ncbi:hypothetical protein RQP46_009217 [Phenoliferia psychrophenolica]